MTDSLALPGSWQIFHAPVGPLNHAFPFLAFSQPRYSILFCNSTTPPPSMFSINRSLLSSLCSLPDFSSRLLYRPSCQSRIRRPGSVRADACKTCSPAWYISRREQAIGSCDSTLRLRFPVRTLGFMIRRVNALSVCVGGSRTRCRLVAIVRHRYQFFSRRGSRLHANPI